MLNLIICKDTIYFELEIESIVIRSWLLFRGFVILDYLPRFQVVVSLFESSKLSCD